MGRLSLVSAAARVSHVLFGCLKYTQSIFWYFFMRPQNTSEESCQKGRGSSGRNQAREYIRIPTRLRCSQPAGARNSKLDMSRLSLTLHPPSPKTVTTIGTDHRLRCQFTVKTTRCLNTDGESACLLTGNGLLISPADWTDGKRHNPTHNPQGMRGTRTTRLVSL